MMAREDASVSFPERFDELLADSTLLACSALLCCGGSQLARSAAQEQREVVDVLLASEHHAVLYAGCESIVPLHRPAVPTYILASDGGRIPLDVDTRLTCAATVGGLVALGDASGYLHLFCAACARGAVGGDAVPLLSQQLLAEPVVHVSGSSSRRAGRSSGEGARGSTAEPAPLLGSLCQHSVVDVLWLTFASGAVVSLTWRDVMAAARAGLAGSRDRHREVGVGDRVAPPADPVAVKFTKWQLPGQRRIAVVEATNPSRGRLAEALWELQDRWGRAVADPASGGAGGGPLDPDASDAATSHVTLVAGGADPSVCMYHAAVDVEVSTLGDVAAAVAARVTSAVSTAVLRLASNLDAVMPAAVSKRLDPVGTSTWMVNKLAGWLSPAQAATASTSAAEGEGAGTDRAGGGGAVWTGSSAPTEGVNGQAEEGDEHAGEPDALKRGASENSAGSCQGSAEDAVDDIAALAGGDAATSAAVRVMQATQATPLELQYELVDGARRIEKVSARASRL
jgi:hypothetical protein